jgi:hypothetical protein
VADDFTERYGDLINGSYDCVDRVVLNAFFSIGHNPRRVPVLVAAAARRRRPAR